MKRGELAIPPPWAQGVGRSNRPAPTNIMRRLSCGIGDEGNGSGEMWGEFLHHVESDSFDPLRDGAISPSLRCVLANFHARVIHRCWVSEDHRRLMASAYWPSQVNFALG